MKDNNKKYLGLLILFIIIIFYLIYGDKLVLPGSKIEWLGFYYKNGVYDTNSFEEELKLQQAPKFDTLQDCMKWGKDMLESAPNDGFECAYGCRKEGGWGVICKDTTKVITGITKEATYKY